MLLSQQIKKLKISLKLILKQFTWVLGHQESLEPLACQSIPWFQVHLVVLSLQSYQVPQVGQHLLSFLPALVDPKQHYHNFYELDKGALT